MRRRAVFMDIDGTLTESGRGPSERVIDAIRRARQDGHLFFVCTGRAQGYLPDELRGVDYLDGFLFGTGTHGQLRGKDIFSQDVPRDVLREVARYFLDRGRSCLFEGEDRVYITPVNGSPTVFEKFVRVGAEDDFEIRFPQVRVTKLTIDSKMQPEDAVFLSQWFTVTDMGRYFEAVLKGNSKATGMEKMLRAIGIPREDSIAIGDNHNDLPMINYAGLGVAMGNAREEVKAQADVVTASCKDDGVAKMIEDYVLTGK